MAPSASTDLYTLLSQNANDQGLWRSQAWGLLAGGDACKSKLLLETLVRAAPEDLEAHLLLADACLELGSLSHEQAVSVAEHAHSLSMQKQIDQAPCALALAVALGSLARQPQLPERIKQQHRAKAIQVLQTVAGAGKTSQPNSLLQYNLAVLLAEAGQLDASMQAARMALELCAGTREAVVSVLASEEGDSSQRQQRQKQLMTLSLVLLSLLVSARQQHETALRVLSAAPSSAVTGPEPVHLGDVLLARLRAQLLQAHGGNIPGAMASLAQLKKRFAVVDGQQGSAPEGLETQSEIRAQVWQDLALLCAASGDHTNATICVQQAIQLCPWQPRSHQVLGQVHEAAGHSMAALESFSTALALEPCHAPTLLKMGTLYQRRGSTADLTLAQDLLSDSLRYDATAAAAWYQLGLVCRGLGHREEAEANLRTAVALAANSPALPFSECPLLLRV